VETLCRHCGYLRQPGDAAAEYQCPKCGAIYAGVAEALAARAGLKAGAKKEAAAATQSTPTEAPSNAAAAQSKPATGQTKLAGVRTKPAARKPAQRPSEPRVAPTPPASSRRRTALSLAVLCVLLAVLVWLMLGRSALDDRIAERMPAVTALIEQSVALGPHVCVLTELFPWDSGAAAGAQCRSCSALLAAGLLVRREIPKPTPRSPARAVYDLSDLGRAIYSVAPEPITERRDPRFCFGRARLERIIATEAVSEPSERDCVRVQYELRLDDPHPVRFDPNSAPLGLIPPTAGPPYRFAPERALVCFAADGGISLTPEPRVP
jgi:hypothetical protein